MISFIFSIPQWLRLTLSFIYLSCIALLSLLPSKDFPELPLFSGIDKVVHFCMYFGLTILACWSMHAEVRHRWYFIVVLFAIGWGVTMEIFQLLMHLGRSFDLYDILANSMGALIGAIIYLLTARMKKNPAY
jgi:VanZ family protein